MADSFQISNRARWLYGAGSAAYGVKDNGFSYFLMFYYSQVMGLPASLAGLAIMIALIFDAISDPLVGYWSDHTHSRWGRRHPFMYAAAIPVSISYFFLWNPFIDNLSQTGLFFYLLICSVLVRFFITLYEIPSTSIVAELTQDYDERTKLLSYRYMFGWYGGLTMAVLGWGLFFADTPEYPKGVLNPDGYFGYSAVGSLVMLLAILGSAWGLHQYIPHLRKPPPKKDHFDLPQMLREVGTTLSNRNFLTLFIAGLFAAVGAGVSTNFNAYINTYFWEFDSSNVVVINLALFLSATLAFVLAPLVTRRFDKKASALGIYAISICFGAAPIVLRLIGWFPDNDSPWLWPIMITHTTLEVTLIVMFGIVQSSMLADVVEHSEKTTGRREEGLFFASRTFGAKATSGLGTFFAGIALDLIQFPRNGVPGEVDPEVIFNLG
ncbi:MAG: MFS transporter, partial [Gammaproteobacteria bacterium]|nr:MFS transporter [Gammaproteobacteria bacterium]